MINWKLIETGYNEENVAYFGNKFFIGNGYMGVRGTLDEYDKSKLVAVNLAGIYDQVGDAWREPVNAPNGFYGYLVIDGVEYKVPDVAPAEHEVTLDYKYGIFGRKTSWNTEKGKVTLETERFVSMDDFHLGAVRYKITADFQTDIKLVTGIDGDVWDINGPHFDEITLEDGASLGISGVTHEQHHTVSVEAVIKEDFSCEKSVRKEDKKIVQELGFTAEANKCYTVDKLVSVYTSKDVENSGAEAKSHILKVAEGGYEAALCSHKQAWDKIWIYSEVLIDGDDKAMEALNYSNYQLHSIAPRHKDGVSIPARGLSGQTYKGAVFWDTEMFMLDLFLMSDPDVARRLIRYRIESLDGAKEKAKQYGYPGAFYAWESQEGGFDACSDYNVTCVFTQRPMRTFFKDKQVHISAAIVYGIGRYIDLTGDTSLLVDGGAETIIECARFYYGLLLKKVASDKYEIHDVIGPDEYHERVNNNGYTNRMAKYTFEKALEVLESNDAGLDYLKNLYNIDELKSNFADAAEHIYIPQPNEDKVIPQFDGYLDLEDTSVDEVRARLLNPKEYWGGAYGVATHTQVIKQADVITWLSMFPEDFDFDTKYKNWKYYEVRTEHGSSLSSCMYSLLACYCNMQDFAYKMFMKSAMADLVSGGKEWAGLVYIGGIHPASHGGAYMVALRGFAGLQFDNGTLKANPNLPENWKSMKFNVQYLGKSYSVEIKDNKAEIKEF